jgi:hypothetical protein
MAAASDVSFDILLGGKIKPEVLKMFKDLEDLLKKQGATARTINAVMGRAYKETFDGARKEAKKSAESMDHSFKEAFKHMAEAAKETQKKMHEAMEKMKESYKSFVEQINKPLEWIGISGVLSAAGGALVGEELLKKGIEVHRARETEAATLRATLTGRGRGAQAPEYEEAAERISGRARVGHEEAMRIMTQLARSDRFRTPEAAERMAMALIGVGGGTEAGAQATMAAYGKLGPMLAAGRVRPTAIAGIGRGGGMGTALLQQIAADTGIPITQMAAAFAPAKVSRRTGEVTGGALAGAKGIDALNKAILELGENKGFPLIKAHMEGMEGMFYRFGEHWEDFENKIGEFFEKVISPIADEINDWLDKINFTDVFKSMIDTGKQWGAMIKNLWDALANTPVVNRLKTMFEGLWKAITGGVELFEKEPRPMWNKEHTQVIMARFMTEAGRTWLDKATKLSQDILTKITDAFQWFVDHPDDVKKWIDKAIFGFEALIAINITKWLAETTIALGTVFLTFLGMLAKMTAAVRAAGAAATGGKGLDEIVREAVQAKNEATIPVLLENFFLGSAAGATIFATIAAVTATAVGHLFDKVVKPPYYDPKTDKYDWSVISPEGMSEEDLRKDATRERERAAKALEEHNKVLKEGSEAQKKLNEAVEKTTGNDFVHFNAALDKVTESLGQLAALNFAGGVFGMGAGGFSGAVTGAHFTEYGPSVPGDQPGGPTYDWNSYHHVGAFPGITGPLRAGDVALGYAAQAKYGVSPGQMFTDEYGRTWRFADRSGSRDPYNVDVFRGALGGIVKRPTRALIGESGPEAILPLSGAGAAGLGSTTINITVQGNADPEAIADAVERVLHTRRSRAAVV